MTTIADGRLIARVRDGDTEALGEIFDSYGVPCLALARTACVERRTAETAVLEAFLQLWRQPPHDAEPLAAWLLLRTQHAAGV